ncbi:MAG: carboxypeptidase regulatory-like domain-containing protein, partial [Acidobacteriaceae bacterium]|nr:carboxypeptidase regulatory-like domain-containing protein [Acidobacteriaceae bacterium]
MAQSRVTTLVVSSVVVVVTAVFLLSGLARAQGAATGAISGEVLDSTGAVIPSAKVQVIDAGTGQAVREVVSSSNGTFAV